MGKWESISLKDVCEFINGDRGKNYPSIEDFQEQGIPFINAGHLVNGQIDYSQMNYIDEKCFNRLGSGKVRNGDILYCLRGSLGKFAIAKDITFGAIASSLVILRPYGINTGYLLHLLSSPIIQEQQRKANNGSSQPNLSANSVKEYRIPLPPLPIQQKIADVLDKASALIEMRKVQIEKLDLLIKSQFIEMFGDPVTNPKGWEEHLLSDFIIFMTSGSRGWSEYFTPKGEMFLTIKNVKNSKLLLDDIQFVIPPTTKEAQRTRVQEDDLLISITADLGRTAVVSSEIANYGAYINQHLALIRLDRNKVAPIYISHFLESKAGEKQFEAKNQIGVKSGLNFDAIKSLVVLKPPLPMQMQFVSFVSRVDEQKKYLHESLISLELNYKSLMQKCFSGEMF